MGILAAFFTVGILGIILGIAAIVLGVKGRRKVDRGLTMQHRGLATGGVVTGIISTLLGLLILALLAIGLALIDGSSDIEQELERQQRQLEQQQR